MANIAKMLRNLANWMDPPPKPMTVRHPLAVVLPSEDESIEALGKAYDWDKICSTLDRKAEPQAIRPGKGYEFPSEPFPPELRVRHG